LTEVSRQHHLATRDLWQLCIHAAFALAIGCSPARAERTPRSARMVEQEHAVTAGQTLGLIAARYGISIASLEGANGLRPGVPLQLGQILMIPAPGIIYVKSGETLGSIAKAHQVSIAELAQANKMRPEATLQVGQTLLLPGFEKPSHGRAGARRWGLPKTRGVVSLYRIASAEKRRIRLLDAQGQVPPVAVRQLRELLKPRGSKSTKPPNPRLVRLLARVSDYFGGREIHIVSGYRKPGGYTRTTSRHVSGEAIDFRIPGVPLEAVRDYCSKLGKVGIGLYPRGQFVHLDVRKADAHWTDWSGPGEAPKLSPPPLPGESGTEESRTAQAALDERPEQQGAAPSRPAPEAERTAINRGAKGAPPR
jgi:uncharacterized protein YcbK (DUF882 family)